MVDGIGCAVKCAENDAVLLRVASDTFDGTATCPDIGSSVVVLLEAS